MLLPAAAQRNIWPSQSIQRCLRSFSMAVPVQRPLGVQCPRTLRSRPHAHIDSQSVTTYAYASLSPLSRPNPISTLSTAPSPLKAPLLSLRPPRRQLCFNHTRMSGGAPPTAKDPSEYRLPTNVKPTHYDITIRTDLEKLKFDGFVIAQYAISSFIALARI